jgi:hypothetical protein
VTPSEKRFALGLSDRKLPMASPSKWVVNYTDPVDDSRLADRGQRALRSVGFNRPNAAALARDPQATATVFAGIGAVAGTLFGAMLVALICGHREKAAKARSDQPIDHK